MHYSFYNKKLSNQTIYLFKQESQNEKKQSEKKHSEAIL